MSWYAWFGTPTDRWRAAVDCPVEVLGSAPGHQPASNVPPGRALWLERCGHRSTQMRCGACTDYSCGPQGSREDCPSRPPTRSLVAPRTREAGRQEIGRQDPRARARQGARAHEQGDPRPQPGAGHRGQDALLEHRGGAGRPRPSQGATRRADPRGSARGAKAGEEGCQEGTSNGARSAGCADRSSRRRRARCC